MPTHNHIERLRKVDDAKRLLTSAPTSFQQHVKNIVNEGDDDELWRQFWRDASLTTWKHTLEHALDETTLTSSRGRAEETPHIGEGAVSSAMTPRLDSPGGDTP